MVVRICLCTSPPSDLRDFGVSEKGRTSNFRSSAVMMAEPKPSTLPVLMALLFREPEETATVAEAEAAAEEAAVEAEDMEVVATASTEVVEEDAVVVVVEETGAVMVAVAVVMVVEATEEGVDMEEAVVDHAIPVASQGTWREIAIREAAVAVEGTAAAAAAEVAVEAATPVARRATLQENALAAAEAAVDLRTAG